MEAPGINRLLRMKGLTRLEVNNEITDSILNNQERPGIRLKFIEGRIKQDWIEYNVLYEALKLDSSPQYLSKMLENLSSILRDYQGFKGVDTCGIQEVCCSNPSYYYFLIYIITDRL